MVSIWCLDHSGSFSCFVLPYHHLGLPIATPFQKVGLAEDQGDEGGGYMAGWQSSWDLPSFDLDAQGQSHS